VQSSGSGPSGRTTSLPDEVATLIKSAQEKAELETLLAQLREANQNLVLATVNAQSRRDDAEEANRRQTEFLAMLAHELRNPLAPIGMAASLMSRTANASPQMLSLAQVIARQVEHMSHLLDDLLDAARISSGKITLSLQPVALTEIVEQAVETVAPRMRERGQQLQVELDSPVVVHADRVRLTQVFTNLLANSCKYTGDGGVIKLATRSEGDQVVITVEDNGSGIDTELLPYVFDLFIQGPRSLARSEGGLGVGLNVVRNLVGLHGGRADAYSAGPGLGSAFTVVLPVSDEAPLARLAERRTVRKANVMNLLLIEDNVDACDTLRHLLTLEGHQVQTAYDGKAGLAAALEGGFDALICDIGLPGLDGMELVGRLRRSANGRRPYAIALSGYCQAEDRSRAMEAGFDHYCVKPVSAEALIALLASDPCQRRRA
jgi:signal transduction histidine kinase/ActR/RegA family two-component response regulator